MCSGEKAFIPFLLETQSERCTIASSVSFCPCLPVRFFIDCLQGTKWARMGTVGPWRKNVLSEWPSRYFFNFNNNNNNAPKMLVIVRFNQEL